MNDQHHRVLRRDAEENRQKILDGAARVFSERGLGVSMESIAAASGVGVATLYRRFPDRDQLVDALFESKINQVVALAEDALQVPDPWQGLVHFAHRGLEMQIADRGLAEILHGHQKSDAHLETIRQRIAPAVQQLIARAQASGHVRHDINAFDMAMAQLMITTVAEQSRSVAPEAWRRSLTILLDGLRARRDDVQAMPEPALSADQFGQILHTPRQRPIIGTA